MCKEWAYLTLCGHQGEMWSMMWTSIGWFQKGSLDRRSRTRDLNGPLRVPSLPRGRPILLLNRGECPEWLTWSEDLAPTVGCRPRWWA